MQTHTYQRGGSRASRPLGGPDAWDEARNIFRSVAGHMRRLQARVLPELGETRPALEELLASVTDCEKWAAELARMYEDEYRS